MKNIRKKATYLFVILTLSLLINFPAFSIHLQEGNWNPQTKQRLEKLLSENAGQNKKVVFDFNSINWFITCN